MGGREGTMGGDRHDDGERRSVGAEDSREERGGRLSAPLPTRRQTYCTAAQRCHLPGDKFVNTILIQQMSFKPLNKINLVIALL